MLLDSNSESSNSSDSFSSSASVQAPNFSLLSSDISFSADEGVKEGSTFASQLNLHSAEMRTIPEPSCKHYYKLKYLITELSIIHLDVVDANEPDLSKNSGYKLICDNVDEGVKAWFMRVEGRGNQSLHYFHACAIQNMVDLRESRCASS